jgi:hypothetical protein
MLPSGQDIGVFLEFPDKQSQYFRMANKSGIADGYIHGFSEK